MPALDSVIDRREREKYQEACELLTRVRELYQRLSEQETWSRYIADLRERDRTLRALKEEMATAKL